jgi:LacI family transcriptional regulator
MKKLTCIAAHLACAKEMKAEISMEDVARAAGCSRSTVSLSLRNHPSVPAVTRNRIRQVAEKLGYRPNPLISALMTSRRHRRFAANATVAVLSAYPPASPSRRLAFYRDQMAGIAAGADALGFAVENFDLKSPGLTSSCIRRTLRARNIRGIIVAPLPQGETAIDFDFTDLAAVALGLSLHTPVMERVANDHFNSAVRAVSECVALGYRRIGFVNTRDASFRFGHRWAAGFALAIQQHRLTDQPAPLCPDWLEDVARAIPEWLAAERPDVVILAHTEKELQKLIPPSIGKVLLGVDSLEDATTGIYQNAFELGRIALEHIVQKLYINSFSLPSQAHDHLFEGIWVRGTTALGPKRR